MLRWRVAVRRALSPFINAPQDLIYPLAERPDDSLWREPLNLLRHIVLTTGENPENVGKPPSIERALSGSEAFDNPEGPEKRKCAFMICAASLRVATEMASDAADRLVEKLAARVCAGAFRCALYATSEDAQRVISEILPARGFALERFDHWSDSES